MIAGNAGEVKVRLAPALGFARRPCAKDCFYNSAQSNSRALAKVLLVI